MVIKPIRTNKQYEDYLEWVDKQFEIGTKKNTPAGDQLEIVLMLIQKYEDEKYAVPLPDAIEAIKLKMQERGMRNKDLVGEIGNKSYVSSILNKRKPLSLEIAKYFHHKLGIPASVLLA